MTWLPAVRQPRPAHAAPAPHACCLAHTHAYRCIPCPAQLFRVIFNTTSDAWGINTSVWAFQAIRWVLLRGLMLTKGYAAYIKVRRGRAWHSHMRGVHARRHAGPTCGSLN